MALPAFPIEGFPCVYVLFPLSRAELNNVSSRRLSYVSAFGYAAGDTIYPAEGTC
jgi:hypothetical protein